MNRTNCKRWMIAALIGAIALVSTPAHAEDDALGVTLDTSWSNLYMWRGYNVFDDHAAFFPSVDWAIFDTGFSVNVWAAIPNGTGHDGFHLDDLTEIDYTLAYGISLFEEEAYALDLGVNYIYFDFAHANDSWDTQEIGMDIAMPNLIPIGDSALVPHYYVGWLWNTETPEIDGDVPGWFHDWGLSYELPLTCPISQQDIGLCFAWDIWYNDGAFGGPHDWTHMTFDISTGWELAEGLALSPAVAWQQTFEEGLGNDDSHELWATVSLSYSF